MKNAIIIMLTLLCVIPELKSFISTRSDQTLIEIEQQQPPQRIANFDPIDEINADAMISNFKTHTLPKLKNEGVNTPRLERTDGNVTQSVSFDAEVLRKHLANSNEPVVTFYFASFDPESAKIYAKKNGMSELDIVKIVQKPTLILKVKESPSINARTINVVGAICPPPNSCP